MKDNAEHLRDDSRSSLFQLISSQARDIILLMHRDGGIIEANEAAVAAYGYSRQELAGMNISQLRSPCTLDAMAEQMMKADESGILFETLHKRKDGSPFPVEVSSRGTTIDGKRMLLSIIRDITEREQGRKALHESEKRYQEVFDNATDCIILIDVTAEGRFKYSSFNKAVEREFAIALNNAAGKYIEDVIPASAAKVVTANLRCSLETGTTLTFEEEFSVPGGIRSFFTVQVPVRDAWGRIHRIICIAHNMTERKHAEERLRKVNRSLVALSRCNEALIHAANEAELLLDICRIIVETGEYQMAWVGYAEQDAEKTVRPAACWGKDDGYLDSVKITWDESETGRGPSGCAIRSGKPSICRNILAAPSFRPWRIHAASRGFCSAIAIPLITEGRTLGSLNIYSTEEDAFDDTEVEMLVDLAGNLAFGIRSLCAQAERANDRQVICESENLYRAIFENTGTAMIIIEEDTSISLANQEFADLSGYKKDEVVGKMSWKELISDLDLERAYFQHKLRRVSPEKALRSYEIRVRDKFGRVRDVLLYVDLIKGTKRSVASLTDITERKKAEKKLKHYSEQLEELVQDRTQQLKDRERLAAVGETAVMIGHDLRNPLQAVVTTVYLAKAKLESLNLAEWMNLNALGLMNDLAIIEKQSEYMNKIVSDLQDYARPLSPERRELFICDFISDVLSGVRIPQNVDVQSYIDERLTWTVDPILMDRVLTNIFNNALQAMPDGGKLIINARAGQDEITLTISDTGVGISPNIMPKLFQPLVTTKAKGMGMGLAVCKRLLEAQGGQIEIESEQGTGTVVIIKIAPQHIS